MRGENCETQAGLVGGGDSLRIADASLERKHDASANTVLIKHLNQIKNWTKDARKQDYQAKTKIRKLFD